VISEELCERSDQNELLWNFGRYPHGKGRLTLKQNPYFYTQLPTLSETRRYGARYSSNPILEGFFQHASEMISVLTDGRDRVYMKIAEKSRAFGGVWIANNAIIFKGSSLSVNFFLRL